MRNGALPAPGTYLAPAIIELKRASDLNEEVFGPVLHVVRWRAGELDGQEPPPNCDKGGPSAAKSRAELLLDPRDSFSTLKHSLGAHNREKHIRSHRRTLRQPHYSSKPCHCDHLACRRSLRPDDGLPAAERNSHPGHVRSLRRRDVTKGCSSDPDLAARDIILREGTVGDEFSRNRIPCRAGPAG